MKKILILLALSLVSFGLAGCASYQGGAPDEYNSTFGGAMNPASPTMRPGMYPQDPRDPNAWTRPPGTTPP